jgi:hypothetical protein
MGQRIKIVTRLSRVTDNLQRFALKTKPRYFLKGLRSKPFKKYLGVHLLGNQLKALPNKAVS